MGRFFRWVFGEDWGVRSIDGNAPPSSAENRDAVARFAVVMAAGLLLLGAVLLIGVWTVGSDVPDLRLGWALATALAGVLVLLPMWWVFHSLPVAYLHLIPPIASGITVVVGLQLGRTFETDVVLAIVIIEIVVSVSMRLRAGLVHLTHMGAAYGYLLAEFDASVPVARWIATMGGAGIVAAVVEWMLARTRSLAFAERRASAAAELARVELAELNRTLEARVAAQVADLDRLGELQRFLPAPVVDAVMSGDPRLLEPHRGEIAVLFCDLRGFTPFVASSQPEEVHELLDAYFEALGEHAQRHGATVGAFTGDGLMAFFNDPLPVPDPAHRAVALALDLQGPVRDLLERWRHVGHDIGFGVGIAMGYANIGMIGFEGRRDYTALGPVVNLAARLCAEAPADAILLDPRASVAVEDTVDLGAPVLVHLKGFERTVEAIPVLGRRR